MEKLHERKVIITGGAGGVGQVVTRAWLSAGAKVLVGEAHQEAIGRLQSELGDTKIGAYAGDLTTIEGSEAMIAEARRFFGGPPDTLIHLVGGFAMGPLGSPDALAQWNKMLALNAQSNFC